ncbi:unnamed protein product, partial [marine sediment metagenome]
VDKTSAFYKDTLDKVKDYFDDDVAYTHDTIDDGDSKVDEYRQKNTDKLKDSLDKGGEVVTQVVTQITEAVGDIINEINITLVR